MSSDIDAKRRLLVEGLVICLQHSAVDKIVPVDTARSVFGSASTDMWRGGEFRLEMAWKILCQQPGLDPNTASPPLLALKRFESLLGVTVVLPAELARMSAADQERLAALIPLDRDRFAALLQTAGSVVESAPAIDAAAFVAAASSNLEVKPRAPATSGKPRPAVIAGAVAVALLTLIVLFAGRPSRLDPALTSSVLALEHASIENKTLSAIISDPRWGEMSKAEQTKVANDLFAILTTHGVEAMALTSDGSNVVVFARRLGNSVDVLIP